MTYELDGSIDAANFNGFVDDLDDVYGVGFGDSGYGQSAFTLANVAVGQLVGGDGGTAADEWGNFLNAAEVCRSHQGSVTTFPPLSEVAAVTPGTFIDAHEASPPTSNPFDINSSIITLETNRLVADAGSTTLFANALQDSRNTSWSNQLLHIFTMTFATVDDARFFFNSGGEVRIRGGRTAGDATTQNTDWTNLLIAMGTITMNFEETTTTGSATIASIGYFDLTTSFQQISTVAGTGAYTSNDATIFARTQDGPSGPNGDRGRILEFRVEYNDDHSNVFADVVNGLIISEVDILKATAPLTIEPAVPSTILATTTSLTAGS